MKDNQLSSIQKCAVATIVGCVLMIAGIITAVFYTAQPKPQGASSYTALPQQEIFLRSLPSEGVSSDGMPQASTSRDNGEGGEEDGCSRPAPAASDAVLSASQKENAGAPVPEAPAGGPADTAAYQEAKAVYQQKETVALSAWQDYLAAQEGADAAAARAGELYQVCTVKQAATEAAFAAYNGAVDVYHQALTDGPERQEAARAEMERLQNEYEALNGPYTAALNEYNAWLSSAEYTGALSAAEEKKAVYQAANAEMEAAKQAWQALK
ncbi:MAG: hypothetical protein Q4G07_08105 [Oscillospiraceae bacterium]|nr:hypothetical protein [Oscillospiraceae bacterium]